MRRAGSPDVDELALLRAADIPWSHPRLATLGQGARLIYACFVDRRSHGARETLESVELVWKDRHRLRRRKDADGDEDARATLLEVCDAIEELIKRGLVVTRDSSRILDAWVMRPWESDPS